jgi:predicted dehydrogenase
MIRQAQDGIRRLKAALDSGAAGTPFRGRISHLTDYPVFTKEPNLKDWERYIIADMGVHLLDTTRFLFGEARSLYCHTQKIHKDRTALTRHGSLH